RLAVIQERQEDYERAVKDYNDKIQVFEARREKLLKLVEKKEEKLVQEKLHKDWEPLPESSIPPPTFGKDLDDYQILVLSNQLQAQKTELAKARAAILHLEQELKTFNQSHEAEINECKNIQKKIEVINKEWER